MKIKINKILVILLFVVSFVGFYYKNNSNYLKTREIRRHVINHPEFLPSKDVAKNTSFGFSNLKADMYWLQTIQYIGSNAASSDYKKYLYHILDLITELNPYFERPYILGQILLPSTNFRYETLTDEQIDNYTLQAELIGQKGIKNNCDLDKVQKIIEYDDLSKMWEDVTIQNPCNYPNIPFYQGYLQYYYLNDHSKASDYYKISSMNTNSLLGSKIMAAVMSGRGGDYIKSFIMFLTLAQQNMQGEGCELFLGILDSIYLDYSNTGKINDQALKQLEQLRFEYYDNISLKKDNTYGDTCEDYIDKAIRQLNLEYLNIASQEYYQTKGEYIIKVENLLKEGYINFIPKDQQNDTDMYIEYYFNKDSNLIEFRPTQR